LLPIRSISPYVPECFDVKICADPDIQAQNPLLAESDDNLEIKEGNTVATSLSVWINLNLFVGRLDEGEEESSSSIISAQVITVSTYKIRYSYKSL